MLHQKKAWGNNKRDKDTGDIKYHHGDLRPALVKAGLKILQERDLDELSLREVARHVGVSATAVYRHFSDKQALLAALSVEGANELGRLQRLASEQADSPRGAFEASGRAYILFALANPGLFRLIMATKQNVDYFSAEQSALSDSMLLLQEQVAAILPDDADEFDHKTAALQGWSMVHGMSMLILDGLIPPDRDVVDRLVTVASDFRVSPKR